KPCTASYLTAKARRPTGSRACSTAKLAPRSATTRLDCACLGSTTSRPPWPPLTPTPIPFVSVPGGCRRALLYSCVRCSVAPSADQSQEFQPELISRGRFGLLATLGASLVARRRLN